MIESVELIRFISGLILVFFLYNGSYRECKVGYFSTSFYISVPLF